MNWYCHCGEKLETTVAGDLLALVCEGCNATIAVAELDSGCSLDALIDQARGDTGFMQRLQLLLERERPVLDLLR